MIDDCFPAAVSHEPGAARGSAFSRPEVHPCMKNGVCTDHGGERRDWEVIRSLPAAESCSGFHLGHGEEISAQPPSSILPAAEPPVCCLQNMPRRAETRGNAGWSLQVSVPLMGLNSGLFVCSLINQ